MADNSRSLVSQRDVGNITFMNARIVFRNFEGKEGQYNREGDRNFCLILAEDEAQQMLADGWNIKYLRAREEGESPQAYVQVSVSFKNRPPRMVLITSRGRTNIPEDQLHILDWIEIANVDLIINPYSWAVSGKTGIKAYLKSFFVTMAEDELEQKYAEIPEAGGQPQLALEEARAIEADDEDIIDAELIYED